MPDPHQRTQVLTSARSIVVKIGTNVVTRPDGRLDKPIVRRLAEQIVLLTRRGFDITVVSSGAIGAGIGQLRLGVKPKSIAMLQATAAVGQPALINLFNEALRRHGLQAAQILLTRADFEDRRRYLSVRGTIAALHQFATVPIVNENDTVAVDEIRYGDNDILAALMCNLLRADLLILLTVVDGLMQNGELVQTVHRIDRNIRQAATAVTSALGTGGMATKLQAAKTVTQAGEAALIANGRTRNVLPRLLAGETLGTFFAPAGRRMASRKRWLALAVRPAGQLVIDQGAAAALRESGKSLLPVGVARVKGPFARGDVVRVTDPKGRLVGQGLVNYSSKELQRIKGLHTNQAADKLHRKRVDEVIHCDNLALAPRSD